MQLEYQFWDNYAMRGAYTVRLRMRSQIVAIYGLRSNFNRRVGNSPRA